MSEPPIKPEIMRALGAFAASVAAPIVYDHEQNGGDQVGTGTLFTVDGRFFLVTAAHLFKFRGCDPGRFAIAGANTPLLWSIGRSNLLIPKDETFDVAVVELLEEATIERAKASWRILTLANTGPASSEGVFILCGFPSERAVRAGNLIRGSRIIAFTQRMTEAPADAEQPVHSALDLFFHYDSEGTQITGTEIATPKLGGCSGASIWEYREPQGSPVWTPEQCLKIVGVQSAWLKGKYFRANSWAAVLEILRQTDDRLAAIVNEHKAAVAHRTTDGSSSA
jgi:hypothetical protein